MRRLNVLHMIHHLGIGGAERVVVNYARFHDRSRYQLSVCCLREGGPLVEEVEKAGVRVSILNKKPGIDLGVIPKIVGILKRESIDILHTHNFTASSWGRVAAKFAGTPLVITTEHNVAPEKASIFRMINKLLAPLSHRIIGVSEKVRLTHIINGKIHPQRIVTIYNGIDPEPYRMTYDLSALRTELRLSGDAMIVGIVGSLTAQKAHSHFLESASIIRDAIPETVFLIVGDGPLRQEIEEKCRDMDLARSVIFTGWRNDVPALLQIMDLFVLSSLWEGCPMVILEAMASAKPMVVTDVGGNSELLGEVDGILVPPKDPQACADAAIALIKDRDRSIQMGIKLRKIFNEKYHVTKMVSQTELLYNSLYSRSNRFI